jgi:hypothetical protein
MIVRRSVAEVKGWLKLSSEQISCAIAAWREILNRKQEIVLWLAGLVVAGICAYQGSESDDWLYTYVAPVMIVAALVLYRLRTPRPPGATRSSYGSITAAVVLMLAFLTFHHARRADEAAEAARVAAESADEHAGNVESAVEELER